MTSIYKAVGGKGQQDFWAKKLVDIKCDKCGHLKSQDQGWLAKNLWGKEASGYDLCYGCLPPEKRQGRREWCEKDLYRQKREQLDALKYTQDQLRDIEADLEILKMKGAK